MIPAPVLWENDVLTIRGLLDYAADTFADNPCIRYREGDGCVTKSYRTMREDSYSAARYIRSLCPERSHIALIGKTDYAFIAFFNGIFVSANVAVPLGFDTSAEDLADEINFADVSMVLYDRSCEKKVGQIRERCPGVRFFINMNEEGLFERICTDYNARSVFAPLSDITVEPDECTVMLFTSGTTGARKAAMLSSRAVISNVYYKEMSFTPDETTLNVLPMHHIFCFSCDYLKNLKDGICIALNGDLANIGANLLYFQPHFMRMVPMVVESLLRKVRILRKKDPALTAREAAQKVFGSNLHFLIVSGAYLGDGVAGELLEMGITVRQGYGMTETGPRISVPDGNTVAHSGGRVISTCDVRIRDGEIQVKSPSLMMGYYKNREETEKVYTEDGWFRTGDMGRLTEDRELFITGRLKNIIILSNGENVSPEEIENKYKNEPLIREILVYSENGVITADVFPDSDYAARCGIDDIRAAVQALIEEGNMADPPARSIRKFTLTNTELPKTGTGKIKRKSNT